MMSRITLDLKRFHHHQSRIGQQGGSIVVPGTKDPPGLTRHPDHHSRHAHSYFPHSPHSPEFQPARFTDESPHNPTTAKSKSKTRTRGKRIQEQSIPYGFGEVSASSWRSVSRPAQSNRSLGGVGGFGVLEGLMSWRRPGRIQHIQKSTIGTGAEDSFFSMVTMPDAAQQERGHLGAGGNGGGEGQTRTIETMATRGGGGTRDEGVEVWREVEVVTEGEEWWLGKERGGKQTYSGDEEMGLGESLGEDMREDEEREERQRQRAYREAGRKGSGESSSNGSGRARGYVHDPPVEMVEMVPRRPKQAVTKGREPPPGFTGIGFDRDGL